jgi:two-component system sensor histidine kinase KdpD
LLEEIVGSALRRTKHALGQRNVGIELATDLPLLFVDGLLMEQVFINILENAARYTPEDSRIVVKANLEGKSVVASIADNGPGLLPDTLKVIFERYYRGVGGPDAGRGSGLGLAICRAIVQIHQGTIEARNRVEGGAEFVIRLHVAENSTKVSLD